MVWACLVRMFSTETTASVIHYSCLNLTCDKGLRIDLDLDSKILVHFVKFERRRAYLEKFVTPLKQPHDSSSAITKLCNFLAMTTLIKL
uniref:Uncharacterized protein n=1 Tax=Rhizophora mucronata TaxID=61149 RepID=A0A2P2P2U8_RHIMU